MKQFYILFIISLSISIVYSSIFNTPCKINCKKDYIECYNSYNINQGSFSFSVCATQLDKCLFSCIHPNTFQPHTVEPGFNIDIPSGGDHKSNNDQILKN